MTDLHILGYNISFGYEDFYNYHDIDKIDIDIDKILLLKKSDDECFVRYNDVNKNKIVPLQLKINNFSFGELEFFADDTAEVDIGSNEKIFFIKCGEIWNKIIDLMDIDNPSNFAEYFFDENGDDAEDQFIMLNIEKKYKRY